MQYAVGGPEEVIFKLKYCVSYSLTLKLDVPFYVLGPFKTMGNYGGTPCRTITIYLTPGLVSYSYSYHSMSFLARYHRYLVFP